MPSIVYLDGQTSFLVEQERTEVWAAALDALPMVSADPLVSFAKHGGGTVTMIADRIVAVTDFNMPPRGEGSD